MSISQIRSMGFTGFDEVGEGDSGYFGAQQNSIILSATGLIQPRQTFSWAVPVKFDSVPPQTWSSLQRTVAAQIDPITAKTKLVRTRWGRRVFVCVQLSERWNFKLIAILLPYHTQFQCSNDTNFKEKDPIPLEAQLQRIIIPDQQSLTLILAKLENDSKLLGLTVWILQSQSWRLEESFLFYSRVSHSVCLSNVWRLRQQTLLLLKSNPSRPASSETDLIEVFMLCRNTS